MSNKAENFMKSDEIWVGNVRGHKIPDKYKSLKTARVGKQAFDINGLKINNKYMRPMYINKSEETALALIQNNEFKKATNKYR